MVSRGTRKPFRDEARVHDYADSILLRLHDRSRLASRCQPPAVLLYKDGRYPALIRDQLLTFKGSFRRRAINNYGSVTVEPDTFLISRVRLHLQGARPH